MTTINMMIDVCSMGETTETATAAFIKELTNAIKAEFPAFDVTVKTGSHSELHVNVMDSKEINERIYEIQNHVWENGQWHHAD